MPRALLAFVIGNASGPEQTLELDAVLSEQHQLPAEVMEHPVELGADFADSINVKNRTFQLEATVASYQLDVRPEDQEEGRADTARRTLEKIRETGTVVRYVSSRTSLSNCALSNLTFGFDAKDGQNLHFSAQLTQFRVVQTKVVQVLKKRVADLKAKGKTDKGAQATEAETNTTVAFDWFAPDDAKATAKLDGRAFTSGAAP